MCAGQMNVPGLLSKASMKVPEKKLAESLVEGKLLFIEGGEYHLNDHNGPHHYGCGRGCRMGRGRHQHRQGDIPQ